MRRQRLILSLKGGIFGIVGNLWLFEIGTGGGWEKRELLEKVTFDWDLRDGFTFTIRRYGLLEAF